MDTNNNHYSNAGAGDAINQEAPKAQPKVQITPAQLAQVKKEYKEDREVARLEKKKPYKMPWAKRSVMNKSKKKPDQILVFLLNLKKQIEGPILTKIYGGNFLVIRNHVYRFNPDRVFTFDKYKAVIAREFDRELVGVDDYEELMIRDFTSKNPGGRVNIDDPVLIKALIQARLSEKPAAGNIMTWVIVGLLALGLVVGFFMLSGKKEPTVVVTPPATPTGATGTPVPSPVVG